MIRAVVKKTRFERRYPSYSILASVGVRPADFIKMGILRTKAKAKREFRRRILDLMSNGGNEDDIRNLIVAYRKVQRIKRPPLTIDNAIAVLEIQRGYRSTIDTDFGLNGPDR